MYCPIHCQSFCWVELHAGAAGYLLCRRCSLNQRPWALVQRPPTSLKRPRLQRHFGGRRERKLSYSFLTLKQIPSSHDSNGSKFYALRIVNSNEPGLTELCLNHSFSRCTEVMLTIPTYSQRSELIETVLGCSVSLKHRPDRP